MTASWPTAQEIAEAQAGTFDRNWSCFDLSDCRHTSNACVEKGGWAVEICEACGHTEVRCTHANCEWNTEGTLLRCTTCGIDGT